MEARTEEFKSIRGFEDHYDIGNLGTVRSVERLVMYAGQPNPRYVPARIRKASKRYGRPSVVLSKDNVQSTFFIDELVEEAHGSGKRAFPKYVHAGQKVSPGAKRKKKGKKADVKSKRAPKNAAPKKAPAVATVKPTKAPATPPAVADLFADIPQATVEAVFTRHWTLTRGRKELIPDSGLQNLCIEFGLSLHQVKEIIFFRAHQSITEPLLKRLAK